MPIIRADEIAVVNRAGQWVPVPVPAEGIEIVPLPPDAPRNPWLNEDLVWDWRNRGYRVRCTLHHPEDLLRA